MTNTIVPEEYNFVEAINQLTEQVPDTGFDGLSDLLLLLNDLFANLPQSEESGLILSDEKIDCVKIFFEAAEVHLQNAPDQKTIDKLINNIQGVAENMLLDDEDLSLIQETLLQDQAIGHKKSFEETISNYREQLRLFQEQAEAQELSGILDIIYLFDEWLEENAENNNLSVLSLSACSDIVVATQAYLSGSSHQETTINSLISSVNNLDEAPLLEQEDSDILKGLLQKETAFISQAQSDLSITEKHTAVDSDVGLSSQDNDITEIPAYLEEYIDILSNVFLPIKTCLDKFYTLLQNRELIAALDDASLEDLNENMQKFTTIAQTAEFIGLSNSCKHVQESLPFLKNKDTSLVTETVALFYEWSNSINVYLVAPLTKEKIHKIVVINCSPTWPVVIEEERAANLLVELQSLDRRGNATNVEERQRIASVEDVSLALPDDVSAVLVDSLLEELPEQTATFSTAIEQLSLGGSMDDITVAQRVAHTLKGAGNTVGVKGIANLTHHLEDILTALANENILPGNAIMGTLQRASDCLEEMTETLTDNSLPPQDAIDVLQEILDVARRIDDEGIIQIIQADSAIEESKVISGQTQQSSEVIDKESRGSNESEQMIRLPVSAVDKLLQFSDEMTIINGQLREYLKHAVVENKLLHAHLEQFHYHSTELLGLVDMQRIHQIQNQVANSSDDDFDSLEMDQYNELYSTSLRIHEMTSDSREMNRSFSNQLRDIDSLLIEQGYLNGASQTSLLDIRTIPVQSIVSRLQRGVRQASRMSGKKVELQVKGQDLLVDRDILNNILDPLMHLLRNAVGHGIEDKIERLKSGKPEQGSISLSFYRDRNMFAIDCIDDGSGLNLDAIKNKALKIGMISEDTELTDDELKKLIMQPNFSTQDKVSQISGRGVGMDAVNSGIRALGGTLQLESEAGKGCVFHILLPLSLAHHNCLLINIGSQTLAIAELGIEQILLPDAGVLYPEGDEYRFVFDDKEYTVKTIESLLSRVRPDQQIKMEARTLLLINHQEHHFAIAVESVKNVKDMIVKELDDVLPHIRGVIGASLLDDGSIAPVMDLQELLEESSRWGIHSDEQFADQSLEDQARVLVVDDSLSARRSLEQFFSDMGYQIMAARDGLDAIDQLDKQLPDLIVTDMEMPRVNGIELTEYLRRNEATKDLPVVMITSRATAKHKKMAEDKGVDAYVTKPYSEDELSNVVLELLTNQQS
jgi:chemosensory pili system protein ChpA (sensor histidine kinase/response regulator)